MPKTSKLIVLFFLIFLIFNLTFHTIGLENMIEDVQRDPSPKLKTLTTVSVLWNYSTFAPVASPPALADVDGDNKLEVIFGSSDHNLYCINGENGIQLWNYTAARPINLPSALGDVDGDGKLEVVFFGASSGYCQLYCLNAEDGSETWIPTLQDDHAGHASPTLGDINDDNVLEIFAGYHYGIHCINGTNGVDIFISGGGPGDPTNSPSIGDLDADGAIEIIVGSVEDFGDNVYSMNHNGSTHWNFDTDNYYIKPSAAIGDMNDDGLLEVIIGGSVQDMEVGNSTIYCINGTDGSSLWKYSAGDVESSPALGDVNYDGKLEAIIGSLNGQIYCFNGEDGNVLWNYTTGGSVRSSAAIGDADGDEKLEVIIGSDDGQIYCLNGEDGSVEWIYITGLYIRSSPVLGDVDQDGTLEILVGSGDTNLYCLKPSSSGSLIYWQGLSGDNNFTRAKNQAYLDKDFDLISDYNERLLGSNISNPDTDGDGLDDNSEILIYLTNATLFDTDSDGLNDSAEVFIYLTNATNPDTDYDGLTDGKELLIYKSNPSNPDSDNDTLLDGIEVYTYQTDPNDVDSDDDLIPDDWEVAYSLTPTNPIDSAIDIDGDGLINLIEFYWNTNPRDYDSDNDGYSDGAEVTAGADPLNPYNHPTPDDNDLLISISILIVGIAIACAIVIFGALLRSRPTFVSSAPPKPFSSKG